MKSIFAAAIYSSLSASLALYIPNGMAVGGAVNAASNGNNIQAFWGPNGYLTTSFGPGFKSQMSGQFGPGSGSVSNSVSRVQAFSEPFHLLRPLF
ncbi:hypothetical protein GGF46_003784 [Coemansia sp. RSA 552]|nr:hypothetical protein GGF46_003784 [Coemansia sp. RSA 552]